MPNFKKLAATYEKPAVIALERFINIPSVYSADTATPAMPYGKDVNAALTWLIDFAKGFGFEAKLVGGRCAEISIGDKGPLIGVYGHSDVVPATGTWTGEPFKAIEKDGKIIGRGAADDKGPLLASLFALKLLKDNDLIDGFRVKLVSGGDEERGSSCLKAYFNDYHGEEPVYGFTPDADYPLIYAEKGIRDYWMSKILSLDPIIAMDGGVVMNAVNDSLLVTLKKDPKFESYLKESKVDFDNCSNDVLTLISFKGKTSHGAQPEKGVNAAILAFKAIGDYYKIAFLQNLAATLSSPFGAGFGGESESLELGKATYNYGIVKYDGKSLKISLDFRYGEDSDPDSLIAALESKSDMNLTKVADLAPLLFDKKSPLISTLMKVYKRETFDLFAKPLAIGGGTYAKEAKNTVAFGASFKGHEGNMHSPDEYIYLEDFQKDIAIYADAIYSLGKIAK